MLTPFLFFPPEQQQSQDRCPWAWGCGGGWAGVGRATLGPVHQLRSESLPYE